MTYANRLRLAALLLAFAGSLLAADEPPPLPKDYDQPLGDSGDSLWTRIEFRFRASTEWFYQRLRAASGKAETVPLPADFSANLAVPAGDGLVAVGHPSVFPAKDLPAEVVWYSPREGLARATPPLRRDPGKMLTLADQSVLLVGGRLEEGAARTNAVERVRRTAKGLEFERLPDIPGPVRHGYALVALADGRAMVLGGSDYTYTGCGKCLADTYLLDPAAKTWSAGPKMLEPRADATATLLPDGSVLVAGGWTPGHDWNEESSRTSERWDPGRNVFAAGPALPVAVAMHGTQWAAGAQGRLLLLAGGMARAWEGNDAVLAYDVAADQWRTVGEGCTANSKDGSLRFGTRLVRDMLLAWCRDPQASNSPMEQVRLRPGAVAIDGQRGYALRRGAAAVAAGGALLAAGGTLGDTGTFSAAVDLFGADGKLRALASLNHARYGARAFAPPGGGYLVAGGIGGLLHDRPGERPKLPMEWLPAAADIAQARWRDLEPWFTSEDAVTQEADGSLLVVSPAGAVERLRIEARDGQLRAERTALPGLGRARESGTHYAQAGEVRVRSLPGGRIVVAGGLQRQRAVAVVNETSLDEDAVDTYAEIGEPEISRRYETYDPAGEAWRSSTPAKGQGGRVAILDSGQVVMVTPSRMTGDQRPDGTWPRTPGLLEISSLDGQSWRSFAPDPKISLDDHARPFVLQGELMLVGQTDELNTGGGAALLQWYDAGNQRWVTLWEAPARSNWREHQGRMIIRDLAGKRLIIPVEGL